VTEIGGSLSGYVDDTGLLVCNVVPLGLCSLM